MTPSLSCLVGEQSPVVRAQGRDVMQGWVHHVSHGRVQEADHACALKSLPHPTPAQALAFECWRKCVSWVDFEGLQPDLMSSSLSRCFLCSDETSLLFRSRAASLSGCRTFSCLIDRLDPLRNCKLRQTPSSSSCLWSWWFIRATERKLTQYASL